MAGIESFCKLTFLIQIDWFTSAKVLYWAILFLFHLNSSTGARPSFHSAKHLLRVTRAINSTRFFYSKTDFNCFHFGDDNCSPRWSINKRINIHQSLSIDKSMLSSSEQFCRPSMALERTCRLFVTGRSLDDLQGNLARLTGYFSKKTYGKR